MQVVSDKTAINNCWTVAWEQHCHASVDRVYHR